jgi:hypothetical protein
VIITRRIERICWEKLDAVREELDKIKRDVNAERSLTNSATLVNDRRHLTPEVTQIAATVSLPKFGHMWSHYPSPPFASFRKFSGICLLFAPILWR